MTEDRQWPEVGQKLVHRFRKQEGKVVAEVVDVNRETGKIAVKVRGKVYPSLSSAAAAVIGHSTNGWTFWGLKKQEPYRRRRSDTNG